MAPIGDIMPGPFMPAGGKPPIGPKPPAWPGKKPGPAGPPPMKPPGLGNCIADRRCNTDRDAGADTSSTLTVLPVRALVLRLS